MLDGAGGGGDGPHHFLLFLCETPMSFMCGRTASGKDRGSGQGQGIHGQGSAMKILNQESPTGLIN